MTKWNICTIFEHQRKHLNEVVKIINVKECYSKLQDLQIYSVMQQQQQKPKNSELRNTKETLETVFELYIK